MNIWDAAVILLVACAAGLALRRVLRKKNGCSCGGACGACACSCCAQKEKKEH